MSDDLKKRRPLDSSRINIHEEYELNWWSDHFGVSKQAIINAVKAVGTSAAAVKKYLGK
jgi:predicted 3-demethylubiquinone-9 3-methyltransferase (glyoxalase superfamily)